MRIARILAENLTTEEQELLLWLSLNELPFESDGVSNLRALRLVERKLGSSNTACVTPFGYNVIAALQEMKVINSD